MAAGMQTAVLCPELRSPVLELSSACSRLRRVSSASSVSPHASAPIALLEHVQRFRKTPFRRQIAEVVVMAQPEEHIFPL